MHDDLLKRLPGGTARFIASAPGRLDVIGGIAEYTGALEVHIPLAQHACAAVAPRNDGLISVVHVTDRAPDSDGTIEFACGQLRRPDGSPIDATEGRQCGGGAGNEITQGVMAVLVED